MLMRIMAVLLIILHRTIALNILMYIPTLSFSHVAFNMKIAESLQSSGHRVTALLVLVDETLLFGNSSDVETITVDVGMRNGVLPKTLWRNPGPFEDSSILNKEILWKLLKVSDVFDTACNAIATDTFLHEVLTAKGFHVAMVEQYDYCGFGLFETIGIPHVVWLSATGIFSLQPRTLNIPQPASYVPELLSSTGTPQSFSDRLWNVLVSLTTNLMMVVLTHRQSLHFGANHNLLLDASSRSESILLNSQNTIDMAMPQTQQLVQIGGVTIDKRSPPLSYYWQQIADSATGGFVIVSFGAIAKVDDMPERMKTSFFAAFRMFPSLTFIVKHESVNCSKHLPSNVVLQPWIPQISLIAHPHYKAMITHGGWSSILESLTVGRPLILMPLFADHGKNAAVASSKGFGIVLDKQTIATRHLVHAIEEIISDSSYTTNAVRFGKMLFESPAGSVDQLLNHRVTSLYRKTRRKWERPRHLFEINVIPVAIISIILLCLLAS